jgi:hypothetical protein
MHHARTHVAHVTRHTRRPGGEGVTIGRWTKSALPTVGGGTIYETWDITAPATEAAKQWQGWGTALKPALEPITVARKPLGEKTVAANVLAHGTGGINVDGCRISAGGEEFGSLPNRAWQTKDGLTYAESGHDHRNGSNVEAVEKLKKLGRWPANLIHDGSDEVNFTFTGGASDLSTLPDLNRQVSSGRRPASPARFFYCAKASKRDRDAGCEGMVAKGGLVGNKWTDQDYRRGDAEPAVARKNHHPTVKPTALMRYLCRLVTPPEGIVLDPFMGSGSTGKAALLEGFQFVGIERDPEYFKIATSRIAVASHLPSKNG